MYYQSICTRGENEDIDWLSKKMHLINACQMSRRDPPILCLNLVSLCSGHDALSTRNSSM